MSQQLASNKATYPCGICSRGVGRGSVRCHLCSQWFHGRCTSISRKELLVLAKANTDWRCASCLQTPGSRSAIASDRHTNTLPPSDASPPFISDLPASPSRPEQDASNQLSSQGSPAECVACSSRSRRKATITCGSCQQLWHASCAKVPAGKARQLPVWHCPACLGRARAVRENSTDGREIPAAGITEGLANLRRHTKLIARIPKNVRPLVADALSCALEDALCYRTARTWWNFLSFAFFTLRAPSKGDAGVTAAANIRRQLSGLNRLPAPSISSDSSTNDTTRGQHQRDTSDAMARRVLGKCADGDIRSALRLLTSDDTFAEPDADVIAALRLKHPAAPEDEQLPPPPTPSNPAPLMVTLEEVEAAIKSMPPGSSGGLDGIRPLHLRQLISSEAAECGRRLLRSLTTLTNMVLAGQVPDCVRDAFFSASLCALSKKSGGLRPIAVGSVYRRLPSRIGARHLASSLGAELRPTQLGVGTALGCEAAVHSTRRFIEASRKSAAPHVLVKIDVSNAFNTVRRDIFLACIKERCPEVYHLAHQAYSAPSPLIIGGQTITSASGVQQGDPLGPALFALAVDPFARAVAAPLNVWYLDDGTIAGPADTVAADIKTLRTTLSSVGLALNPAKCEVAFLGAPDSALRGPAISTICSVLPDVKETQLDNLSLLGSPLTDGSIAAAGEAASAVVGRLCARLRGLDRHTAVFFLAHHVSAPRLTYLLRSAPTFKAQHTLRTTDETVCSTLEAVSNVAISPEAWEQASLPVKLGGLGIRSVAALALPAYIASVQTALPLIHAICPGSTDDEPPACLETAVCAFLERTGLERHQLHVGDLASKQRVWDTLAATVVRDRLLNSANQIHRARLLAASQPHTAAWIQALPVPSLGLHLDDETIRVSVALRLGAPICEPHHCRSCARSVTSLGLHGLSCPKSAGRHPRHAHLNDVVRRSLSCAGFPATLEPVGLDRGDGRRPDGLTVYPFREGRCLTWDVTCVDTFADTILMQSALEPGAAARQAEERKKKRYADLAQRYIFEPVALETSGVYGPAAAAFVQDLGRRISARTGERRETAWLRQRLSVAIARGNAASILATAPCTSVENANRAKSRAATVAAARAPETPTSAPATNPAAAAAKSAASGTPASMLTVQLTDLGIRSTTSVSQQAALTRALGPSSRPTSMALALTGLNNLGNTCFMNAVVQCINNTPALRDLFASKSSQGAIRNDGEGEVAQELAAAIEVLWSGQYRSVNLHGLRDAMGRHTNRFRCSVQQDAHEFLVLLLDCLHEGLNEVHLKQPLKEQQNDGVPDSRAANLAWNDFESNNRSFIISLFWGQLKSTLRCACCGNQSVRFEVFSHLSVPMPAGSSQCSLHECIRLFMADDTISDWTCPKCKSSAAATKRLDIWRLPPVLIIHIQRFHNDGLWMKKQSDVTFPSENLEMSPYVINKEARYRHHQYHLYGVVNHFGSMESGHYTAFCRSANTDRWHKFDDHEVHQLNSGGVQSSAGYILFYAAADGVGRT